MSIKMRSIDFQNIEYSRLTYQKKHKERINSLWNPCEIITKEKFWLGKPQKKIVF